ncbi:MAG: SLBB domain-containing protein [Prolixibacteraceae bacterium]
MHTFKYFLLALLLVAVYPSFGQQQDVSGVNVENLSDEQIQKVAEEVKARGLTMEQAASLARARGASQLQIDQMMQRIRQMETVQPTEAIPPTAEPDKNNLNYIAPSKKEKTPVSPKNKKLFGYQLFNQENLTFEPSVNIPVPTDYVLGIGDEVTIQVWGASQQTYNLQVGTNGAINIPGIGPVSIANQNFSSAKKTITNRLTSIYDGMNGSTPNTYADVTVNNPRSIKVNVIGEAIAPGTYTVPATASAFNVLYLSGGPNENGSFRDIRIMRNNKLLATVDVYDYLINGNAANNVSLRDQDILFIPTYQKRVETEGSFKRNAIFELREGENISQLLDFTGGFTEEASSSRLLLTRFANDQYQLKDIDKSHFGSLQLQNGDLIHAEKVIDRYENRLTIEGAVFRPGSYALEEGMTLSQLIKKAGGLREDYFANRGLIIRLDEKLFPTTLAFDLEEVMQGKNDPRLQREDQVVIHDIFSIGEKKSVRILGEVMKPGEFEFRKNMILKDLIFLAGGMTEAASESYIEVARRNSYEEAGTVGSKLATLYQFRIGRDLKLADENASFMLQPFDQVYVRRAPSYETQRTVSIRGEVQYPGEYSISDKNERISDLVKRAGGLTPTAFAAGAKLRRTIDQQAREQLEVIETLSDSTIDIAAETEKGYADLELRLRDILNAPGHAYDYLLREGDEITVPTKTEEIWVNGEVLNPIGLAWENGRGIKYYINRAGGFSDNARKSRIYVIDTDGTTKVTKSFIVKNYPEVSPGSRIIVPAKPEKEKSDNIGRWLAITTAMSSLAIAFAAVFK